MNSYLPPLTFAQAALTAQIKDPDSQQATVLPRLVFSLALTTGLAKTWPAPTAATALGQRSLIQSCQEYDRLFHCALFYHPSFETLPSELLQPTNLAEALPLSALHGVTPLDFAQLYESFLLADIKHQKKQGAFYTPPTAAQRTINLAFQAGTAKDLLKQPEKIQLLDPACGSGIFLLLAWQKISAVLPPELPLAARLTLLQQSIYGVDCDPLAVELAKFLLLWEVLRAPTVVTPSLAFPNLASNLKCGNSLLEPDKNMAQEELLLGPAPTAAEKPSSLQLFSWQREFPDILAGGGFSQIVGNPPYGLARGEQLSKLENEQLKERYRAYRSGKVNKYLFFLARGYELLRPQGSLAFIVPNSWLGINDGLALRKFLLQQQALKGVTIFQKRIFPDPSVEAVIVTIVKGVPCQQIEINHYQDLESPLPSSALLVPVEACLKRPDCPIPLHHTAAPGSSLERLLSNSFPLNAPASPFISAIALQAYATGKGVPPQSKEVVKNHSFHSNQKESADYYPYLEGADITRYQINWSGQYLKYGPWLAEPQRLERFAGPRLLLREIIGPYPRLLIAAFTSATFLYNKSVLHILPKQTALPTEFFWALLAILNSTTASFVVRAYGRKSQRQLFPKIVNADLKDFPLPLKFKELVPTLAPLAQELATLLASGQPTAATVLEESLDRQVAKAYGLEPEELKGA